MSRRKAATVDHVAVPKYSPMNSILQVTPIGDWGHYAPRLIGGYLADYGPMRRGERIDINSPPRVLSVDDNVFDAHFFGRNVENGSPFYDTDTYSSLYYILLPNSLHHPKDKTTVFRLAVKRSNYKIDDVTHLWYGNIPQ